MIVRAFILLLFSNLAYAADTKPATWSWVIDGSITRLTFAKPGFSLESGREHKVFKERPCSKKLFLRFRAETEKKLAGGRKPALMPKNYVPIFLTMPDKTEQAVLRGTPTGLYLLNFSSELTQFRRMEVLLCR
jgi:hypothetical protein